MRRLALDVGNTHVSWGIFEGPVLECVGKRASSGSRDVPAEWAGVDRVLVASVNRDAETRLLADLRGCADLPAPIRVGTEIPVPVETRLEHPEQVGVDRLLNALAWSRRESVPAVIVDFGTAVTFDLVSATGAYLGGLILPGPELVAAALHRGTSLLPAVAVAPTSVLFGRDTLSAIQRGIFGLFVGGVEFHVSSLRTSLDPNTVFVATGGGAATFAPWVRGISRVVPHLTLDGVRHADESRGTLAP